MSSHRLKSGQINFENTGYSGSYACVVIRDGVFHNLTGDLKQILIKALNGPDTAQAESETTNLEDMF